MTENGLQFFLQHVRDRVDEALMGHLKRLDAPEVLKNAMMYSITAGGKRIRPALLFAALEGFGKKGEEGMTAACALEMIHTYSLIHDDLPAMDNDDLRRGEPTNHKVFGEAQAILAGDALLTYSFQLLADAKGPLFTPENKVELIARLAKAAGAEGMVAGQSQDLLAEGRKVSLSELESIHQNKTGKLLTFAVEAGAILARPAQETKTFLRKFAVHLGLAFQIKDDLLDVEGDAEQLGKNPGSDENKKKSTYPGVIGVERAKETLNKHLTLAKKFLYAAKINHRRLEELADFIVSRNR